MAVQRSHINFLELSGVFLSLQWFLTFLRDHHGIYQPLVVPMLPAVAHTSMQTVRLELRSSSLSLRATHVPGNLNAGADLLSRATPLYR